ncbi:MAG: glutathione peroxidase [Colwellia sp.]|nr:glutathione peroxidase [Colwellia sp.]
MFTNKEGDTIPSVSFPIRENNQWSARSTDDIFTNKTVVVFSLPGAFTPTCSSAHLPRYSELAKTFFANGVDEIICISVNDTFVMNAWAADQSTENVSLIPDGNGDFTDAMGLLVDKKELGFGKRSWRYAMLVKNGVIDKMFIEPNKAGDPFEVSDADTMLNYINPNAVKPNAISVLTKPGCEFCAKSKALLTEKGLAFEELILGEHISAIAFRAITNAETYPQVFINGELIGDSEALAAYIG